MTAEPSDYALAVSAERDAAIAAAEQQPEPTLDERRRQVIAKLAEASYAASQALSTATLVLGDARSDHTKRDVRDAMSDAQRALRAADVAISNLGTAELRDGAR